MTDSQAKPPNPVTALPIKAIKLPAQQPRRYFDPDKLAQLTESVKHNGILENLLVRPLDDNQYELVVGERRYRAAQEAGLTEVPVTIKELTDNEALQISLIENLQREDLNPVEETEGILWLLSLRLGLEVDAVGSVLYQLQNQTKQKVATEINTDSLEIVTNVFQELGFMSWESFVNNRLPLLKLPPDILEVLRQGKIAYTKAKALVSVKDPATRRRLLLQAVEENLSLGAIKEKIAQLKPEADPTTPNFKIKNISRHLNKTKLWEKDPKRWEKVQDYLAKIEAILAEVDNL
ncbi:ParB/RepB/Spo0J family partition protein [Limnospira fusiformis KN01]|uniref:ParB/RepB/Spo0J family partition protein n=1 Tax=Limnospira TaxID=2596745 RepID=UPI001658991E|nr:MULTISPECIES: ParB/RepB/Spo0J family partition protein [Limnospira]MDT9198436.1 ParB/RepB/Spo0J family partition protein [Limnospira sp. PMC 1042.18]ULB45951.1 ParB/RepB/Spo0J family partition protein [Limnospira fusiformis KN01]